MIWANLLHLSYNMWVDHEGEDTPEHGVYYRPHLRFDKPLWRDLLQQMADAGFNMVLIDLGDAVRYESHPEIAVKRAWTPAQLRKELDFCRKLGLEPIPKLNFSAAHDTWLGPYHRMVSTDAYYAVCRDLIDEVVSLFDKPRFFHIGMDEETAQHQRRYEYAVLRQHDLWWRDFHFYVDRVERRNIRAWIWSDYVWHHPELFYARMPKSVLQSNWYYRTEFHQRITQVQPYVEMERRGYDQVPTGSNWNNDENMLKTVQYCRKRIDPQRLMGFMTAPWHPTMEIRRPEHERAIRQIAEAKQWFQRRGRPSSS